MTSEVMEDSELLARLLTLFETRQEAEHVVTCDLCDIHSDFGDAGPYRCANNPVSLRETAERTAQHVGVAHRWYYNGCPQLDGIETLLHHYQRQAAQQYEHTRLNGPLFTMSQGHPSPI